jgi:hypothetical protein
MSTEYSVLSTQSFTRFTFRQDATLPAGRQQTR